MDEPVFFECEFCRSIFLQKNELESHKQSHRGRYRCFLCPLTFTNQSEFHRHQETHRQQNFQKDQHQKSQPQLKNVQIKKSQQAQPQTKKVQIKKSQQAQPQTKKVQIKKAQQAQPQLHRAQPQLQAQPQLLRAQPKPKNVQIKKTHQAHPQLHQTQYRKILSKRMPPSCDSFRLFCDSNLRQPRKKDEHQKPQNNSQKPIFKLPPSPANRKKPDEELNIHKQQKISRTNSPRALVSEQPAGNGQKSTESSHRCKTCKLGFGDVISLYRHELVHDQKKPRILKKQESSGYQKSALDLITCSESKRVKSYHHRCDICTLYFRDPFELEKHKISHEHKRQLELRAAGKTKDKNGNDIIFECPICHESFYSFPKYWDHRRKEDCTSFRCDGCLKFFPSDESLQEHMAKQTCGKMFQCDLCGRSFYWRSSFERHMNENNCRLFECITCGEQFVFEWQFEKHQLLYGDRMIYRCVICNKCFHSWADLQLHLKAPPDIKPEEYTHCQREGLAGNNPNP